LGIVLEHDHLHPVADVEHLGGVGDPPPRHVGDVEQPVDAAEVDEGAVVGDVLDRSLEDHALLEHLERLRLERRALALEDGAPGDDDVAARAVELEDGEAAALAEVAVEVARRTDVGVRAGQEGRHADVDPEPALHLADDGALDGALALEGLLDLTPHLELLGLLPRQEDLARLGVRRLEVDVDLVALLDRDPALTRAELGDGDLPLGLVPDVDGDGIAADAHHATRHHVAGLRALQALLEQRAEVVLGADPALGLLGPLGHQAGTPWWDSRGWRCNWSSIALCPAGFKAEHKTRRKAHRAGSESRARAIRSIWSTTASSARVVVSSTWASRAARSGECARSLSRRSRSASSRASAVSSTVSPRARSSTARRRARSAGAAVRKSLAGASGKTTVPMSRPSITMPPGRASARWSGTSRVRTTGRAATREASSPASARRIASERSRPPTSNRSPSP